MVIFTRDPLGTQPYYFARTSSGLVHSESLARVLAHRDVPLDLDEHSVADHLAHGVLADPSATVFAHVRRVPPGHHLHDDGAVERWWTLPPRNAKPGRHALAQLESALKAAIADRIVSRSAIVFLSGGLDSTLLAALAREVHPETRVIAATSVYRTRIADVEEPFADEAASSIGIPIRKFVLDDYDPLDALAPDIWTADPGAMLTSRMTRDIYREAAQDAPVALHGHPADAVLTIDLARWLDSLPRAKRIRELVRYTIARRRPPYFYVRPRRAASHHPPPDWLRAELPPSRAISDPLESASWSNYFEWAHPQFTGAALDVVYPWADPRVIEAAFALEPVPWLVDKHASRELLRGRVSERIRTRPKAFLAGNPWQAPLPDARVPAIEAASRFIDAERFAHAIERDRVLSDRTLRAIVFESWLRKLPRSIRSLREEAW